MKISWMTLLLPLRWIMIIVLLFLAWQTFVFLRPRPRHYSAAEVNAITRACQTVADRLAQSNAAPTRFAVAHFGNDPGDHITETMRQALASHPEWTVAEGSPINQFLRDISHTLNEATSLDEILNAGRRVNLDVIVTGSLLALESTNDTANVTLRLNVYDTRAGSWAMRDTITASWTPTPLARVSFRLNSMSWLGRFITWLIPALLLPWLTPWITRFAMEKRSNFASALLLGFYTVLGLMLGVGVHLFYNSVGNVVWSRFFIFFIVYGIYVFWVCEKIAFREKA